MKESDRTNVRTWKRPLKGWPCLAALVLITASLALLAWAVLDFTVTEPPRASALLLPSLGLGLAVILCLTVLVAALSSWRDLKRLLLGLGCVAGLVVLFYAEEDIRGRLAWTRFKAASEAKGEKLDFAAFIPPPVPDDQNFALAPVVAGTYGQLLDRNGQQFEHPNTNVVNRLMMPLELKNDGPTNGIGNWQKGTRSNLEAWQRYYRNLALTTNVFPVAPQPQTPAADVLLALSKYDAALEELRRASALPASRFPLNYAAEEPFSILLPHLAPLKSCTGVLRLRALAELESGNSGAALDDVLLALRLSRKITSDTFPISYLVRISVVVMTEQVIWEGLASHAWSDAQLARLEEALASFDFVADYQSAMRTEAAAQVTFVNYLRRHRSQVNDLMGTDAGEEGSETPGFCLRLAPSGWFYRTQAHCAKFLLQYMVPAGDARQRTFSPDRVKDAEAVFKEMQSGPVNALSRSLLSGLTNSPRRFAMAQASVNLARAACALERYRLAEGGYPENLDALAPKFIPQVPRDPIGGQPLRYRRTEDGGFVLYSIGWNDKDDGGTLAFTKTGSLDQELGDWVWRYPAAPKP